MKKFNRIILLLISLIFVSTYSPNNHNLISKKDNNFFKIKNIEVMGNSLVQSNEVKEKLNKIYNKNIFLIRKKDIEEPLNSINFIEKVIVKKKYPNIINIKIFETKPIAILFKNKIKYLLDSSYNLVVFENYENFAELPSVFGDGAEDNFAFFFNQLKNNNFPKENIKKYYFFQIGRWDLELENNKIIKFPNNNVGEAIKKSIKLLKRKDFINYNIIDLRVDGKIIVE